VQLVSLAASRAVRIQQVRSLREAVCVSAAFARSESAVGAHRFIIQRQINAAVVWAIGFFYKRITQRDSTCPYEADHVTALNMRLY
jgi:hypothetical protein